MSRNLHQRNRAAQRGFADALVPLMTLIVLVLGGVLLVVVVASLAIPASLLKGKKRLVWLAAIAAAWCFALWWSTPQPQKIMTQLTPHYRHFKTVCQQATINIRKVAQNVDAVAFQAPRREPSPDDLKDPNFVGDVYGSYEIEVGGRAEYSLVSDFLTKQEWSVHWRPPTEAEYLRYPMIEVQAVEGGRQGYIRYVPAGRASNRAFSRSFTTEPTSRYLVRWEDISTASDRKHWVAGSRWTIVDNRTGEVMAERIAYAIDLAQGRTEWGPTGAAGEPELPWARAGHSTHSPNFAASSCPPKTSRTYNFDFVSAVLRPVPQSVPLPPAASK